MNYSSSNTELWNFIIQFGIIAAAILLANFLRRAIPFVKNSLMPTTIIAGFLLFGLRNLNILNIDVQFLEYLTYHGIALGFIALSLRVNKKTEKKDVNLVAPKSGAIIVGSYLLQGVIGLLITLALSYTIMPDLFKASGLLLPMGYGQGPGQANNIGGSYESLGFVGGRSFGLAIAAAGYICACIVGIIYINVLVKKGKVSVKKHDEISGSATVDTFEDNGEIPISQSIDRFSMQVALVLIVYLLTYLLCYGIDSLVGRFVPSLVGTLKPLLWGFNFIFGSALAMAVKSLFGGLKKKNIIKRQYQNNYLLSRISGLAFDMMIVSGIASINIEDLKGLWVPFIIMAVLGGIGTLIYLRWVCKKTYPNYYYEGLLSMYGMMTGTISSGVLLLREIDPNYDTPAANNLVTGSSFAILFGIPMLLLVGMAPKSDTMVWITLGLAAAYFVLLVTFILKIGTGKRKKKKSEGTESDIPKEDSTT